LYLIFTEIYQKENIVGVFVFGSWNLGSWDETSDVDTLTLINSKESFENFFRLEDGTGEISYHISIDRILDWYINGDAIRPQSLEIWATPYYWANPKYETLVTELRALLPELVNCNKSKIYKSAKEAARLNLERLIRRSAENYHTKEWRKLCYHSLQLEKHLLSWLTYKDFEQSIAHSCQKLTKFKHTNLSFSEIIKLLTESAEKMRSMQSLVVDLDNQNLNTTLERFRKEFKSMIIKE
jgi:predicted nucleotidyltransferase/predicted CopG family antitoxin